MVCVTLGKPFLPMRSTKITDQLFSVRPHLRRTRGRVQLMLRVLRRCHG
jgi:hypothetical protein